MTKWTRRGFIVAGSASVAACSNSTINQPSNEIGQRVDAARAEMFRTVPGAEQLANQAAGVLIVPDVTQAGFMFGGAYGEGSLMIGNAKVANFSYAAASFGPQIGVQKYHHALFFMTQETLTKFRYSDGWQLGVDAEFTTPEESAAAGVTTTTINLPIYALVFGQQGLLFGATLEGGKYTRVER